MGSRIGRILRHEAVTLGCAVMLIGSSLWEVGGTLVSDLISLNLSTGHGVLIFGTVHALRATQELLESRDKKHDKK